METKTVSVKEWLNGAGRNACDPAKEWLTTLGDEATMLDAWNACERPDWMRWSARRSSLSDIDPVWKQLGFAICRKTEIGDGKVLWDIMPEAGKRCVETAERFVAGLPARGLQLALLAQHGGQGVKPIATRLWQWRGWGKCDGVPNPFSFGG